VQNIDFLFFTSSARRWPRRQLQLQL